MKQSSAVVMLFLGGLYNTVINTPPEQQTHTRSFIYGLCSGITYGSIECFTKIAMLNRYQNIFPFSYLNPLNRKQEALYEQNTPYFYGSNCIALASGFVSTYIAKTMFKMQGTYFWQCFDPEVNKEQLTTGFAFGHSSISLTVGLIALLQSPATRGYNYLGFSQLGSYTQNLTRITWLEYKNGQWYICGQKV